MFPEKQEIENKMKSTAILCTWYENYGSTEKCQNKNSNHKRLIIIVYTSSVCSPFFTRVTGKWAAAASFSKYLDSTFFVDTENYYYSEQIFFPSI